jgi:hypothetical protein
MSWAPSRGLALWLRPGVVQCENHLPCYKDNSCSLPLLLSMMSSNNRGDKNLAVVGVVHGNDDAQ